MKISIVTGPWFPVPTLQGGAVPRLWQGLAEQFVAMGHQVTIVCRSYPSQPQQEIINGVKYFRYSGFPQSRSIAWDLLKDLAYALLVLPVLPRADILVINDFWLPVFASTLRSDAGQIVINANRFPKGQYFLYAGVTRIAAASRAIKEAIAKQCPPANSRLRVIPNPIDTNVFYPPVSSRSTRKDKTILYAGRVHPEKGIHLLIDAFAILCQDLSDVKLRIIGPFRQNQGGGGEDYLHSLKIKAQELLVEFSEPIFDGNKLAEAYRNADLFCYPSLADKGESFGVAPLEAMATGLVPIVSNLDCFRDFIEEGKTGYFFNHRSPNAAKNLSSTLASALLNHKATGEMAINASRNAICFSYEKIAKLYLTEFEKLIKQG